MLEYIKKIFSKKNLLNNLKLKILSLVLAFALWVIVVSITDPIIKQPYRNIQVRLVNTSSVTDEGKTYEILGDSNIIENVQIFASRSIIRELGTSNDCIIAIADFSKISVDHTTVPVEISTSKYNDKIDRIRSSSDVLSVKIENKKSIQLPIQTVTSGDIESGYILGNVYLSQNQVKISGPESVIERIKTAKVEIQVSGFTENITTQADIILYDESGDAISKNNLTLNADNVKVTAEILQTKKVSVKYETFGNPAEGYALTGEIECSPESVVIAGASADIANISDVTIPSSELNITGQSGNFISMVDLSQFLPADIRFADSSYNGRATVKVYIEKLVEDNFGVDAHEIKINNVPEGFTAEVEEGEVYEYILKGLAQNLERISLDSMNYYVDFEDITKSEGGDVDAGALEVGVYELQLHFDIPENVTLEKEVFIKIRLSE